METDAGMDCVVVRRIVEETDDIRQSQIVCDLVIKVGKRRFPVHKLSLVQASSFFHGLLGHENTSDEVELKDVCANVFEQVLNYIYTGKVRFTPVNDLKIMNAAHLYKLPCLVGAAADSVAKHIRFDNAVDVYRTAVRLEVEKLKTEVTMFIAKNLEFVRKPEMIPGELVKVLGQEYGVGKSSLIRLFEKWRKAKAPKAKPWSPLPLIGAEDLSMLLKQGRGMVMQFHESSEEEKSAVLCTLMFLLKKKDTEVAMLNKLLKKQGC